MHHLPTMLIAITVALAACNGTDARINEGVQARLAPAPGPEPIEVTTRNGIVTLRGFVVSPAECAYRPSRSPVSAHRDCALRGIAIARSGASRSERSDAAHSRRRTLLMTGHTGRNNRRALKLPWALPVAESVRRRRS